MLLLVHLVALMSSLRLSTRQELNKQWKEVVERNYEKSFDHRSFYFRQQDKRAYTAKVPPNLT